MASLRTHFETLHKREAERCIRWQCYLCRAGRTTSAAAMVTHLKKAHNTSVTERFIQFLLLSTDFTLLECNQCELEPMDCDGNNNDNSDDDSDDVIVMEVPEDRITIELTDDDKTTVMYM